MLRRYGEQKRGGKAERGLVGASERPAGGVWGDIKPDLAQSQASARGDGGEGGSPTGDVTVGVA